MRKLCIAALVVAAGVLCAAPLWAADANIRLVLPTAGCSVGVTPCDNKPLTGAYALTKIEILVSTSPIPDNTTAPPTLTLAPTATTGKASVTARNGDTLYTRMRACNAGECSALTAAVLTPVVLNVIPNIPTSVTVEIVLQ